MNRGSPVAAPVAATPTPAPRPAGAGALAGRPIPTRIQTGGGRAVCSNLHFMFRS